MSNVIIGDVAMKQDLVNSFLSSKARYFPQYKLSTLKRLLENADDNAYQMISTVSLQDPTTVLAVSVFLGYLGLDRFMIGDYAMGILKIISFGCCGILYIVDIFCISERTRNKNYEDVSRLLYL